jgi:hypothetical protein
MIYRILKRMIERGNVEGMVEKIDVFYASNKLSANEYKELISLIEEI